MIIGISGSKFGNAKIAKFLCKKYLFEYLDVDEILEEVINDKNFVIKLNENGILNDELFLNIKNEVDRRLLIKINNFSIDRPLVIGYSLLEDSFAFEKCNLIFKNDSISNITMGGKIEVIKKYRCDSIISYYNDSKYHLKLDFEDNWQEKLSDFINYNVYNTKKVTVIVPVYNTANYLIRCINSITNQTYQNLEIILIDDGSIDESLKICDLLAKNDDRIKVIHQKNIGLAETRNKGIEIATGEYICFFDSDDYIENTMIETLLRVAEKTDADVCESSFYIHMKDGDIKDVSCEQKGIKFVSGHLDLINSYSDATILIPAWDKLYKLSSIKSIKFDRNCFKEDSDYIYKLCMNDKTFALVNVPFYHYVKRKAVSLTGNKISLRLFTLQDWGKEKYNEVLSQGEEYRDAAEKILYNSLVHIIRNYIRDYKNGVLGKGEYKEEIQSVVNDTMYLLLSAKNVEKFRKLNEVLEIINELVADNIIEKEKMPSIEIPCIGILWNSLDDNLMNEAIDFIKDKAVVNECIYVDLKEEYNDFINDIYRYNNEFEGIPYIKACTLIDKFDSNVIVIMNMILKVTNYMYYNNQKGFIFEEIAELKSFIRKYFKKKIKNYAYDNIFHLTVNGEEYRYIDEICKKYIKEYRGNSNEL